MSKIDGRMWPPIILLTKGSGDVSEFVEPDVKRLYLTDGPNGLKRWIEVKTELTNEEWEQLATSGLGTELGTDGKIPVNFAKFRLSRLEAWVTDWSFRDRDDKPVPVTATALAGLRRPVAQEIEKALDAHVKEWEAQGEATAGETESAPSSN